MVSTRLAVLFVATTFATSAFADALTEIIQQDLTTLGVYTGEINGEATTETVIAVSKFQAENGLEVTGEITPQLAGVVKAAISQRGQAAPSAAAAAAQPQAQVAQTQAAQLQQAQAAQQACLQEKIAAAQEAQQSAQRRRGFGSLMRAVSRIGGNDVARAVAETQGDLYDITATISDLESAARDLGLTEADVESCRLAQ